MQSEIATHGIRIPKIGFGTFRMQGDLCRAAVESALSIGYRHVDTAAMYGNEGEVGAAIASSGVSRDKLHLTTKVWHDCLEPQAIRDSVATSLDKLRVDHVDLLMVHWPSANMDIPRVFDTFEALRAEKLTRAIGACNFNIEMVKAALDSGAPIACIQVEYHVLLDQTPLLAYLRSKSIALTAYAPIAHAMVSDIPVMKSIARKHDATPTQVALKWLVDQDGVIAIPKSQRPETQKSNLECLSIVLDDEDRARIADLPKNRRLVDPPFAPAWD
ncbi:aldo/keto reductase [Rhizobium leguminosarum]|uniref:aldo/keto reductase n=1 Tax=Rhizobium TaxID=379 RepID=UPI0010317EEC|nr:aldo/keto reductase [Rhizobium leguminosarum]TBF87413.1 aldo/keto reductase [Rhizobium leguminosarum]TBG07028.1 aldo/keto reductase [Rhizobium leguminosarum]TBG07822.1 aldo/keto reductase [Rhizobium leguminosarum]TBG30719.1 aldo/keto reductase [Rhizobium leguminosarum]TBG50121.1 aldo/keto reductase [Rhizobium leguminosarum]